MKENPNNSWPTQAGQQRSTIWENYWITGLILVGLLLALPGFLILTQTTHPNDDRIAANATVAFLLGMAIISVASIPTFVRSIPMIIRSAWSLWFARRPWLRFGLRTFFVLAMLFCIYVGWAINWEWKRQAYLKEHNFGHYSNIDGSKFEDPPAPWNLRLFNETGIPMLYFECAEEKELIEASRLFPETDVCFVDVTKNGVFTYTVLTDYHFLDYKKLPYYKNGVLFRKELLIPVTKPNEVRTDVK